VPAVQGRVASPRRPRLVFGLRGQLSGRSEPPRSKEVRRTAAFAKTGRRVGRMWTLSLKT